MVRHSMIDTDPIPHADLWAQERERSETLWLTLDLLLGAVDRHLAKLAPEGELAVAAAQARSLLREETRREA